MVASGLALPPLLLTLRRLAGRLSFLSRRDDSSLSSLPAPAAAAAAPARHPAMVSGKQRGGTEGRADMRHARMAHNGRRGMAAGRLSRPLSAAASPCPLFAPRSPPPLSL